ncbi:f-box domain-containing [Trichoderma cornu-damae]|uniref:F-box domain-containing n=1 Tax=Trichoderma cornu-damae TaxID=654480 RepID=A0A9P8TYE6_9HYPO|nr:f-box domain-containing [Trichoderma cornu-damae]
MEAPDLTCGPADGAKAAATAAAEATATATATASSTSHETPIYGRVDAANEDSLDLLSSAAERGVKPPRPSPASAQRHRHAAIVKGIAAASSRAFGSLGMQRPLGLTNGRPWLGADSSGSGRPEQDAQMPSHRLAGSSDGAPPLLTIPPELVDAILSHLSALDLAAASATCRALRRHALSDLLWQPLVQQNVPGVQVASAGPCASYRELYATHDRLWFLPRYKIWFCDRDLTGRLVLVRYDPRRGCIEGYQLVAVSSQSTFEHWSADPEVIIHGFEPVVKLHLDRPVLQFRVRDRQEDGGGISQRPGANRFADEMPMALDQRLGGMFSNFLLTTPLRSEEVGRLLELGYPYGSMWPSPVIPANHYVSGVQSGPGHSRPRRHDRPRRRSEVSDQTFRIRQWMELAGTPSPLRFMGQRGLVGALQALVEEMIEEEAAGAAAAAGAGASALGVHIGEELITYSTLDPALYTPTPEKPWRGIWVGDYSGHGCEFLLIHQPDDPPATDAELGIFRGEDDSDEAWQQKRLDARVHRGRLEGIKLTGDPNVPRGEYTFVVNDLGPDGLVGTATDAQFAGARIVKSQGHIAATGFLRDKFIESQLILISPNKLAQHWIAFGHVSFLERVNIDQFLVP